MSVNHCPVSETSMGSRSAWGVSPGSSKTPDAARKTGGIANRPRRPACELWTNKTATRAKTPDETVDLELRYLCPLALYNGISSQGNAGLVAANMDRDTASPVWERTTYSTALAFSRSLFCCQRWRGPENALLFVVV